MNQHTREEMAIEHKEPQCHLPFASAAQMPLPKLLNMLRRCRIVSSMASSGWRTVSFHSLALSSILQHFSSIV